MDISARSRAATRRRTPAVDKLKIANGNGDGHATSQEFDLKKLLRALQSVRDGDFSVRLANRDGTLRFNDKISWPLTPFIGTLGVAPDREVTTSLDGQGERKEKPLASGSRLTPKVVFTT